MATTTNAYETAGRLVKATRIADILAAHGYGSAQVAGFNEEQRVLAASAAQYTRKKAPSPETWEMVVKLLRQREEAKEEAKHG